MTVRLAEDGSIRLERACPAEDAATLHQLLLRHPEAPVDWRACAAAHTAIVQLLLAADPPTSGPPGEVFLANWIQPLLRAPVA